MLKKILFSPFLLSSICSAEPIPEGELIKIMESVNIISNATRNSDIDVLVDYMPPKVLTLMGGRENALHITKASMDGMAAQNVKILDYSAKQPKELVRTSLSEIVLVPTLMLLETPDVKVQSSGFLIASRALGEENWTFMDASGIKKRSGMEALFPNYPKERAVPHTYTEIVE